ncbi:MAG: cytochrome C [Paracoccaceae bacterium]
MKPLFAALFAIFATPALAGDPVAGKQAFAKCRACHAIIAPDGSVVQKGGKIGPDLYGIIGRQIGSLPGYTYSPSTIAAGADGTKWDEAMIAAFLPDASTWLAQKTGDPAAHSKMAFKLATGGADVAAYLASVAPPAN